MKKLLSIVLAVVIMSGLITDLPPNTATTHRAAAAAAVITRAEWVSRLAVLFDMTVEDDSDMPEQYFDDFDITHEFYRDVMMAVLFEAVKLDSGASFEPAEPASRDFAASTLTFCLGFVPTEDNEEPDYVGIAVKRGWFELIGGEFAPETPVTLAEAETMLEDAAVMMHREPVDPNHIDRYEFAEGVIEIPADVEVELSAEDEGVITIVDSPVEISVGDTFVVYIDGLPQAFIAEEITPAVSVHIPDEPVLVGEYTFQPLRGFSADIRGRIQDLKDIIAFMDIAGVFPVDLSMAEIDLPGVTYKDDTLVFYCILDKFELGEEVFAVTLDFSDLTASYAFNTRDSYARVELHGSVDTTVEAVGGNTLAVLKREDLGFTLLEAGSLTTLSIPLLSYKIVALTLSLNLELDGTIEMSWSTDFEVGFVQTDGDTTLIRNFNSHSFACTVQGTAKFWTELWFGVQDMTGTLSAGVYFREGAGGGTSIMIRDTEAPLTCRHEFAYGFKSVGAMFRAGITAIPLVTLNLAAFDAEWEFENHRTSQHYENGEAVDMCTLRDCDQCYIDVLRARSWRRWRLWNNDDSPFWFKNTFTSGGRAYVELIGYEGRPDVVVPSDLSVGLRRRLPPEIPSTMSAAVQYLRWYQEHGWEDYLVPADEIRLLKRALSGNPNITSVSIPHGTWVEYDALADCTGLVSARLGISISYGSLFTNCTSLTDVVILNNVTSIGGFKGCTALTEIPMGRDVTHIGRNAFEGCTGFTEIVIPDGITHIGNYAFKDCTNLTSITLPESVAHIGENVFEGTGITSITLPAGEIFIDSNAFRGSSVKSVTIPDSVTSIHGSIHHVEEINIDMSVIPAGFSGSSALKTVNIGSNVTSIGDSAFANSGLTSVNIGSNVTSIGDRAFANVALTSVIIPDSVTSIGTGAFYGSGLTSVIIGSGVTNIEHNAFIYSDNLTSVTFESATPPTRLGAWLFSSPIDITFHVPCAAYSSYRNRLSGYGAEIFCIEHNLKRMCPAYDTCGSVCGANCIKCNSCGTMVAHSSTPILRCNVRCNSCGACGECAWCSRDINHSCRHRYGVGEPVCRETQCMSCAYIYECNRDYCEYCSLSMGWMPCPLCDEYDCWYDCDDDPSAFCCHGLQECEWCHGCEWCDYNCGDCDECVPPCNHRFPTRRVCGVTSCRDCDYTYVCGDCDECVPPCNHRFPTRRVCGVTSCRDCDYTYVCGDCDVCNPIGGGECDCNNCADCGFIGGRYGFGRVRGGDSSEPGIDDAVEILKFIVGLDNVIAGNENAIAAAKITTAGNDSPPGIDDAVEVLKFIVGLDNVLDEFYS
jgi:hypothetical protein